MLRTWVFAVIAMGAGPQATAPAPSAPAEFIVRAWSTADGLPQNSVTSILQTRDGYLWLGTFGGLVRFDGQAFTVFDPAKAPGLTSGRILGLHQGPSGTLWIATESGLSWLSNGRFTSLPTIQGVAAVFEDRRGRVWVGENGTLKRFDGTALVPVDFPFATVPLYFGETPDGDVWAGTHRGIARIDANDKATVVMHLTRPSQTLWPLFVDRRGLVWAATETRHGEDAVRSTLWRWDGAAFVEMPLPAAVAKTSVLTLTDDHDGNLWVGTAGDGVYRFRDGHADSYNVVAGVTDDTARALLADADGNIWIGTNDGGLNRLKRRRAQSYPPPRGVQESIGPIVDDGAGGLWIGGTCGGLLHFTDGAYRVLTIKDGLPANCIWALWRDADGTLWIGAGSSGVVRFRDGRFTTFTAKDGLAGEDVYVVTRDRNGVLWAGTAAGLNRFDGTRFTHYGRDEGLEHDVRTVLLDRSGALWVGGTTGLSRFDGEGFTRYTTAQGLAHGQVRAIHEDADGTLWIGTYGGGLNRLRDGRFTTYTMKDGLHDDAVSRIIEDEHGNLWMSGNRGVYHVARRELNDFAEGRTGYITSVAYGTADGMMIDETNGGQPAGWRTPDGRFWFPTIKGLVSIDPLREAAKPPPVVIEGAVIDGQSTDPRALPPLGPGNSDAEFHYTAIDLGAAEKTRFRYRLAGYDDQWTDAGPRRVAYYTGIAPGRYHFEVIATDRDGKWTTSPARLAVVVTPFWWQRREVQGGALILLLAVTGFGVRYVALRRARMRVAELERERALERERTRIARDLHDDLGSRLTSIAMMADAVSASGGIGVAARDAVRTIDELVWAVGARHDTVASFALYLAQFAEEQIVASGARCRLLLPPDLPQRPLDAPVRRHLYLACKEAINNAVKHARAEEIRVALRVDEHELVVDVIDHGVGLPSTLDPTGNGFSNYRERMEAVGGSLTVQSAPGDGTQVTFRVPL